MSVKLQKHILCSFLGWENCPNMSVGEGLFSKVLLLANGESLCELAAKRSYGASSG